MSSDTCGCHGYDLTQGDDYKAVMALLAYVEFYIGGYSEDIQRQVVELLCNGVLSYGEQAQVTGLGLRPLRIVCLGQGRGSEKAPVRVFRSYFGDVVSLCFSPPPEVNKQSS